MPSLETRLHSTSSGHLCHSCTSKLQARRPDPDGCKVFWPPCPSARKKSCNSEIISIEYLKIFWLVYGLVPVYFVRPWKSSEPHRTIRDVTPGTLTATDTCIGYHVTRFEASRNVILHTRYISTCVEAGCGRGRETKKTKAIRCGECYFNVCHV
jgi:hypothetical protein